MTGAEKKDSRPRPPEVWRWRVSGNGKIGFQRKKQVESPAWGKKKINRGENRLRFLVFLRQ